MVLLTAAYNFARFHSNFDFGYFHIPEVRDEPLVRTLGCFRSTRFPLERPQNVVSRFQRRPQLSVS